MNFTDRSAQTEQEMRSLNEVVPTSDRSYPILSMRISRKAGPSMHVGNAGFPTDQMLMAFNTGGEEVEARQFANDALKRFGQKWHLMKVPDGKGAFPLRNCERELRWRLTASRQFRGHNT